MLKKTEFSKSSTLALKGIAIIMMMFHHCFRIKDLFKGYNVSFFPFNQEFVINMSATFKICVSIFVFITGYGLIISLRKINEKYDWTNKEISKWTSRRLIKTFSGYWIIVVLTLIICQLINGRTTSVLFKNGVFYGIIQIIINFLGLSTLTSTNLFCSTWWYMSIASLFIISVPIFAKLFKKYKYLPVMFSVFAIPRILGWKYVDNSYISFLFPLLLGIIFAENNLVVKISNAKLCENKYMNKIIKFVLETSIIIVIYLIYIDIPTSLFWELKYGIIPVFLICYLYEFYIELPIIKQVLVFLGKHSMNIFLIHTFLRAYYLNHFIYSFSNFIEIAIVLLSLTLAISIILELFKKVIRYEKIISKLQILIDKKIDKYIE